MTILELWNRWTDEQKKQALAAMPIYRKTELGAGLRAAGWSPAGLIAAGWSPADLRAAGWSPADLRAAGWSAADLIAAGSSPADLRAAGWSPADLRAAGWSPADLIAAGWSPADLRAAGWSPADLIAAGWFAADLIAAGSSPADLRAAGWSPADLRAAGWSPADLRAAGWSPADLRAAGWSPADLSEEIFESDIKKKSKLMGEVESKFVIDVLNAGLMNGLDYGTVESCGCFLGTAAKAAKLSVEQFCKLHNIEKDGSSPAEQWFMSVSVGDTPENNYAAKTGVKWIEEAIAEMRGSNG